MSRSTQFDRAALDAVLAQQYQVISRRQALASGMTDSALDHRLRAGGPWQRLLPGVFLAVTGAPTSDQRDVAALLYAGPGSVLTGSAALRLWRVRAPYTSLTDVLIPESKRRQSAGFVRIRPTARMPGAVLSSGPRQFAPLARDARMRMYDINVLHFTPAADPHPTGSGSSRDQVCARRASLPSPSAHPHRLGGHTPPGSAPRPARNMMKPWFTTLERGEPGVSSPWIGLRRTRGWQDGAGPGLSGSGAERVRG